MKGSLPEWIEAGGLIVFAIIVSISVSSVALYRLGTLEDKVEELLNSVQDIQLLKKDIQSIKEREIAMLKVFEKFSNSVNTLAISVAKLETKLEDK